MSHPTRVRGLKQRLSVNVIDISVSHPTRVRGLKQLNCCCYMTLLQSHPTRVRGLKHEVNLKFLVCKKVAPYTGAWIETYY